MDSDKLSLNACTGSFGATGQSYAVSMAGRQEIQFRTTEPLGPYSGLTVVLGFPKGVVLPPGKGTLRKFWREEHQGEVFGMYGVPAVLHVLSIRDRYRDHDGRDTDDLQYSRDGAGGSENSHQELLGDREPDGYRKR